MWVILFHFVILAFFVCLFIAWQSDYEWNKAWHTCTPSQYPVLDRESYVFVGSLKLNVSTSLYTKCKTRYQ